MKNFIALMCLMFISGPLISSSFPTHIGGITCKECHLKEYEQWQDSHHALAMLEANESSVLGDFNHASFTKDEITTRFYQDGKRFMVKTDGPDGKLQDYEISYTFGVYPLQQYMVKFPGGKIQVLDIAWDTRTKEEGGQRWFSLHPDETIKAGDVLHWTGPNLNWNFMCADCHSTNLKKNYDPSTKTYQTRYSDINVSCEACHGPGSEHVEMYRTSNKANPSNNKDLTIDLSEVKNLWEINHNTRQPELKSPISRKEVQLCAKCHSRRSQFDDEFIPGNDFRDHYLPSLLEPGLYYPDGKINDEVYVYASFKQSLMYKAGVTCSDCHNAHTLKLNAEGSGVCLQCHTSAPYTTTKHHFHQQNSAGSDCIACHMPDKTYMGVDARNDHSFRIPRPDIAQELDIPDACTNCHKDKSSKWAADAVKQWYGSSPEGYQQFGPALQGLHLQSAEALNQTYQLLLNDTPDIAKATAVGYLGQYPTRQTYTTSLQMLRSQDPDTRRQALIALELFPIQQTVRQIFPKLNDSDKVVRLEAARILTSIYNWNLNTDEKELLARVINEYRQSLLFSSERPESQLSLAQLHQNLGKMEMASNAYNEALRLQPYYVPAYINYSDFYKQQRNEKAALQVLEKGLKLLPDSADLHYALGLWFVRNKEKSKGIKFLKQASELSPVNSYYQFIYAIGLAEENLEEAIAVLEKILKTHSGHIEVMSTLASYYKQAGQTQKSRKIENDLENVLKIKLH